MSENGKVLQFRGRGVEAMLPGPYASAVPPLLAKLDDRLWRYFSHRESPKDLPDNPYEAARAWIQAYGMDEDIVEQTFRDEEQGDIETTDAYYFFEMNALRPSPGEVVIATFFDGETPIMYGAFVASGNMREIHGVKIDKMPDEEIWIEHSYTQCIDEGQDPFDVLRNALDEQLANYPLFTRAIFTHCIIDDVEPPSPGGGEEIPLVA